MPINILGNWPITAAVIKLIVVIHFNCYRARLWKD